ncbi:MAG: NAD-dependent epimerase/dehydratase family protein [Anaerolineales bacterium]
MNILITGAAGNMGSLTARHLLPRGHNLRLLVHHAPLPLDLALAQGAQTIRADLAQPESLSDAVSGIEVVIHYAGVLFRPRPEQFLPRTNIGFVRNLVGATLSAGVRKFVLVSFPQVEGETTPAHPAIGRLDAHPNSIHAQTRLAAEQHLLESARSTRMTPVILRAGVVYARGLRLIEAARGLMRRGLLAIWPDPTWYHMLALPDYLACLTRIVEDPPTAGVYLAADDEPMPVQAILDRLARHWGYRRPLRLPRPAFTAAAAAVESVAGIFRLPAPLTRDVMRIAMASHVCDTRRMKSELLPQLQYPTIEDGLVLV